MSITILSLWKTIWQGIFYEYSFPGSEKDSTSLHKQDEKLMYYSVINYGKCSKFWTLFSSHIKCWINKMDVRIANMEDSDQTASDPWQSDLGLPCLSRLFWQATSVQKFRTFTELEEFLTKLMAIFESFQDSELSSNSYYSTLFLGRSCRT